MSYSVRILRRAQEELARVPGTSYDRVKDAIAALEDNPRPHGCKKLVGREGWRLRIGSYRVIYEIDEHQHLVIVLHIGHRRDVYR